MFCEMLIIGGSLDGQRKVWDTEQPTLKVVPIPYWPKHVPLPSGIVERSPLKIEIYHVKGISLDDPPRPVEPDHTNTAWFLVHEQLHTPVEHLFRTILRHLFEGYRNPTPCPRCHAEMYVCTHCGWRRHKE